jgi:hypothetical protein
LGNYLVGTATVCGVDCWVIDTKGKAYRDITFWIDPPNGCCLKWVDNKTGENHVATLYDLHFTEWLPSLKP